MTGMADMAWQDQGQRVSRVLFDVVWQDQDDFSQPGSPDVSDSEAKDDVNTPLGRSHRTSSFDAVARVRTGGRR